MKQHSSNWMNTIVVFLLSIFPIIFDDFYFNITITKYKTFAIFALTIFFLGVLYTLFQHFDTYKGFHPNNLKFYLKQISLPDMMFLGFLLAGTVSFLGSEWKLPSFTGGCGKQIGLLFMLLCGGLYYGISRHFKFDTQFKLVFPVISSCLCLMAVLQFCEYDVFGFYKNMTPGTSIMYISTFGHVDVFSAFLCVYLPICFYQFCTAEKKLLWLYALSCFLGFLGIFSANSDSSYIGCGLSLILLFVICIKDSLHAHRYQILMILYMMAVAFWFVLHQIFKGSIREQSTLTRLFTSPATFFIVLAVVLLLSLLELLKQKKVCSVKTMRTVFVVIFSTGFLMVIGLFFYFSVIDTETDLRFLSNYLRFNDLWGSERGYVWRWLFSYFCSAPLFIKFFGAGPDTTTLILYQNFKQEMSEGLGVFYASAHNEYLNYLVTIGLLGTLFYIALVACSVYQCFKKQKDEPFYTAIALAILSYSAMAVVNISQPITVPFIFILIALANCRQSTTK